MRRRGPEPRNAGLAEAGDLIASNGRSVSTLFQNTPRASRILEPRPFWFFVGVVVVQSVHMFEHVLQLIQVTVWNVPDDEALGLLGYALQLQGTEEWLHLFFNLALLTSL